MGGVPVTVMWKVRLVVAVVSLLSVAVHMYSVRAIITVGVPDTKRLPELRLTPNGSAGVSS